jgi:hypothetical protein
MVGNDNLREQLSKSSAKIGKLNEVQRVASVALRQKLVKQEKNSELFYSMKERRGSPISSLRKQTEELKKEKESVQERMRRRQTDGSVAKLIIKYELHEANECARIEVYESHSWLGTRNQRPQFANDVL